MLAADLALPTRLMGGSGASSPDPVVLRAMTTPVIGQFDPAFTAVMDDVMQLAREVFRTANPRCFAVSGLAPAGIEALLNSLIAPGDRVRVVGGRAFVEDVGDIARRYGATIGAAERPVRFVVASLVDLESGRALPIADVASEAHAAGAKLLVDASLGLGGIDFGVDGLRVDACSAGVEYCLGAPSGMTLVTYTAEVEAMMLGRSAPPPVSYLDLLQLQAYWSPERLNHHTAPTSLVYGLREALRLVLDEGFPACIDRHQSVGASIHDGLRSLGLDVEGEPPYAIVRLPHTLEEAALRRRLLAEHDVYVARAGDHAWRVGLLGPAATLQNAQRLILALGAVLA